jgi:hypothetical protein
VAARRPSAGRQATPTPNQGRITISLELEQEVPELNGQLPGAYSHLARNLGGAFWTPGQLDQAHLSFRQPSPGIGKR